MDRKYFITTILIFAFITFIVSSGFWHLIPSLHNLPILKGIISHRFQIFTQISLLILACYGIASLWHKKIVRLSLLVFIIFVILNMASYYPSERVVKTSGSSEVFNKEVMPLWSWVRDNVDGEKTRVLYQSFWSNSEWEYSSDSINAMSYYYTNVTYIGGWTGGTPNPTEKKIISTKGNRILGKTIETISNEEIVERLKMVNAKYVVALEPKLKEKLESSGNFNKEYSVGRFDVYSLEGYEPKWVEFEHNTDYELTEFKSQKIRLVIENKQDSNSVLIKVANNPYWKAYLNGDEVPIGDNGIGDNGFGLMKVNLIETGRVNLNLVYNPKNSNYMALSVIGVLLLLFLFMCYNFTFRAKSLEGLN